MGLAPGSVARGPVDPWTRGPVDPGEHRVSCPRIGCPWTRGPVARGPVDPWTRGPVARGPVDPWTPTDGRESNRIENFSPRFARIQ